MTPTLAKVLMLVSAISGCNKASDLQDKANTAQDAADAKIADLKGDANQEMRTVQADADVKIAKAEADFTTMREDYRHSTTLKLATLDQKVADIGARADKANGHAKADLTAKLKLIDTYRGVFINDYQTLDSTSGATWDDTKVRLDREWTDLSNLVDKA